MLSFEWHYQIKGPVHEILYSKICVKRPNSKRQKIGFHDQLLLNAGQKYCKMLQGEHSAISLTFIKLPFVIKIFVISIFEWPFYTGFTVKCICIFISMVKIQRIFKFWDAFTLYIGLMLK